MTMVMIGQIMDKVLLLLLLLPDIDQVLHQVLALFIDQVAQVLIIDQLQVNPIIDQPQVVLIIIDLLPLLLLLLQVLDRIIDQLAVLVQTTDQVLLVVVVMIQRDPLQVAHKVIDHLIPVQATGQVLVEVQDQIMIIDQVEVLPLLVTDQVLLLLLLPQGRTTDQMEVLQYTDQVLVEAVRA